MKKYVFEKEGEIIYVGTPRELRSLYRNIIKRLDYELSLTDCFSADQSDEALSRAYGISVQFTEVDGEPFDRPKVFFLKAETVLFYLLLKGNLSGTEIIL